MRCHTPTCICRQLFYNTQQSLQSQMDTNTLLTHNRALIPHPVMHQNSTEDRKHSWPIKITYLGLATIVPLACEITHEECVSVLLWLLTHHIIDTCAIYKYTDCMKHFPTRLHWQLSSCEVKRRTGVKSRGTSLLNILRAWRSVCTCLCVFRLCTKSNPSCCGCISTTDAVEALLQPLLYN